LPPRALADSALAEIGDELDSMLEAVPQLHELLRGTTSVAIDLELTSPSWAVAAATGASHTVRLSDTVHDIAGFRLLHVEFVRPRPRARLAAALGLAALVACHPGEPWQALVVTRPKSRGGRVPASAIVPHAHPHPRDAALALLATAHDLFLRAYREPVPLFEHASHVLARGNPDEFEKALEDDCKDDATAFLWDGVLAEEIVAAPLLPHDDVVDDADRRPQPGEQRAAWFARVLWGAVERFATFTTVEPEPEPSP
jgi:exonuclease V gamma subunit